MMAKKLIEVALPPDAINAAAAQEESIRHGHPSTLHLWRAPRRDHSSRWGPVSPPQAGEIRESLPERMAPQPKE